MDLWVGRDRLHKAVMVEIWGETKTIYEWCQDERIAVKRDTVYRRRRLGWDTREALLTPAGTRRQRGAPTTDQQPDINDRLMDLALHLADRVTELEDRLGIEDEALQETIRSMQDEEEEKGAAMH